LLAFTPIPSTNGASASAVLGQDNFDTNAYDGPPTQKQLANCWGVATSSDKLFVADSTNNRVLRFDLNP